MLALPFLSSPPRTVDTMSCTAVPAPLMDLLAADPGIPADQLDPEQDEATVAYGWLYEHRGRVG